MDHRFFKWLINLYPPYWATGIVVKDVSADYHRVAVQMKMRWYNRNYVGTHFGGSLYAMVDPFYMLMLMQILGKGYVVWDQSARIEFVKPGKGTVTAEFRLARKLIETIVERTSSGAKYLPELAVTITDSSGEIVAKIFKKLYIRKKPDV